MKLVAGSFISMAMEAALNQGYGVGNGHALFLTAATCSDVMYKVLGLYWVNTGRGLLQFLNLNNIIIP